MVQEKAGTTGKHMGGVTSNSRNCLNLSECANGDLLSEWFLKGTDFCIRAQIKRKSQLLQVWRDNHSMH